MSARVALAIAVLGAALVPRLAVAQDACDLDLDCDVVRAAGVQPCPFDLRQKLDLAANAQFGDDAPPLPSIRSGCAGGALVHGRVPCQILRAFAYARSRWRQFCTDGCGAGSNGPTRVSAACGIGVGGVPTREAADGVDLVRAASSVEYNAGAAALRLARAWGTTPCVGNESPDVAEHWYFAVWAADEFTYANNPNNPAYPVLRGVYGDVSGLDRGSYPFQEVVFGLAANPPDDDDGAPLWNPSPVNLPATADICGTAACLPGNIAAPVQVHDRDCPPFIPPTDGGTEDAGPDAGPADGGTDAGNIVPDPTVTGCGCRAAGTRASGVLPLIALLAIALCFARTRSRRATNASSR